MVRIFIIILIFTSSSALSQDVWLRLERGERKKLDLAIDQFSYSMNMSITANRIREIIEKNLRFSLYFNIEDDAITRISGEVTENELKITIYETPRKTKIMERTYPLREDIRAIAHTASDDIIKILTGERGISRTKLYFITEVDGRKRAAVADYDGYNLSILNIDKSPLSLAPSPDGRKIVYTAHKGDNLALYLFDKETEEIKILSDRDGLNTAPAFSPCGKKVALALSKDGNSEIYVIDIRTKKARRLTANRAIDTSPTWSPTGREIAFVSNRPGSPQIYIMRSDGSGVRRLTHAAWYNTSPRWSPRGDRIAYVARSEDRKLNIYTILVTGEGRTRLTFRGNNEEPSWSKDGLHLAFISDRNRRYELYTMHWDGSGQRKILGYGDGIYSSRWSQ